MCWSLRRINLGRNFSEEEVERQEIPVSGWGTLMDLWIRRWPKSWNHGQSDGSQIERPRAKQQFLLESRFCLVGQVNCCDRFGFGERTARPFLPPPVINLETILFRFRFKLSNELLHLSQQLWTEAGRGGGISEGRPPLSAPAVHCGDNDGQSTWISERFEETSEFF